MFYHFHLRCFRCGLAAPLLIPFIGLIKGMFCLTCALQGREGKLHMVESN